MWQVKGEGKEECSTSVAFRTVFHGPVQCWKLEVSVGA